MRGTSWKIRGVVALVSLALPAVACTPVEPGDDWTGDWQALPPAQNAIVAGTWMLTGAGTRQNCSQSANDGPFSLASGVPLIVSQTAQASAADLLSLATPITPPNGGSFTFSGTVEEERVQFSTLEDSGGLHLVFNFSGTVAGLLISGNVTGHGPDTCTVSGSFEVVISDQPFGPEGGPPGPEAGDPAGTADGDAQTTTDDGGAADDGGDSAESDTDDDLGHTPVLPRERLKDAAVGCDCRGTGTRGATGLWWMMLGLFLGVRGRKNPRPIRRG